MSALRLRSAKIIRPTDIIIMTLVQDKDFGQHTQYWFRPTVNTKYLCSDGIRERVQLR